MNSYLSPRFGGDWLDGLREKTFYGRFITTEVHAMTTALLTKGANNGLEVLWITTFPPNLASMCLTVSEETCLTLDGCSADSQAKLNVAWR